MTCTSESKTAVFSADKKKNYLAQSRKISVVQYEGHRRIQTIHTHHTHT